MESPHWDSFHEFCRLELLTGGPDPHLKLAVKAMDLVDSQTEKAWRAGCYVGPYEVNTGAVIWSRWPLEMVVEIPQQFEDWIKDNWKGLQIRRERRAARTPKKMAESLLSYAFWIKNNIASLTAEKDYEVLWKIADKHFMYFGRYASIKLLEALHRGGVTRVGIPDIRAQGAWSPRKTLSWLFPNSDGLFIDGGNKDEAITAINLFANKLLDSVKQYVGHEVSMFELEVLLCNYRQATESKYPGRPQDTDLKYFKQLREHFPEPPEFDFRELRAGLFPHQVLGEVQGWPGVREELGFTYKEHGYFWCDLVYDYKHTTDLANPVTQQHVNTIASN